MKKNKSTYRAYSTATGYVWCVIHASLNGTSWLLQTSSPAMYSLCVRPRQ